MATKDPDSDKTGLRLHSHYTYWFTGTGAKTEFAIPKTFSKADDVLVFVDGAVQRPDVPGTAYNYALRGVTSGYIGDKNTIKFAVAPPNTKNVLICIIST